MTPDPQAILRGLSEAKREIDCPRCHEQCGWCGDYRHMHGMLYLPGGGRRKCDLPAHAPEGDDCPLCHGSKRVVATTSYSALIKESASGQ